MRKTVIPVINAKRKAITTPAPIPTLAAVESPFDDGPDAGGVSVEGGPFDAMLPAVVAMFVPTTVDNDVLLGDNADVVDATLMVADAVPRPSFFWKHPLKPSVLQSLDNEARKSGVSIAASTAYVCATAELSGNVEFISQQLNSAVPIDVKSKP